MSALTTSFTFRLTPEDSAALDRLAARWNRPRGDVLRDLVRRADVPLEPEGRFVTGERACRVRLKLNGETNG